MIHVDLLDDATLLGIIVLCNSGVVYRNQVGGVSCLQEEAEGAYIPIEQLNTFLPPHRDGNCGGINADDFDSYFYEFDSNSPLKGWRVDRSKPSIEAWVYVTNGIHKGIFTYTNCD
jgi:hypothetical protein